MTQAYALYYAKTAGVNYVPHSSAIPAPHPTGMSPDVLLCICMIIFYAYTIFLLLRNLCTKNEASKKAEAIESAPSE